MDLRDIKSQPGEGSHSRGLRGAGSGEGPLKAQLGTGTPVMGEKPLWIVFTDDLEERVRGR